MPFFNIHQTQEIANSVKLIKLGTGTSFDIKTLVPDIDYTKLTKDNFLVVTKSINAVNANGMTYNAGDRVSVYTNIYGHGDQGTPLNVSYDTSTGIVNITKMVYDIVTMVDQNGNLDTSRRGYASTNIEVYLFTGTITNI